MTDVNTQWMRCARKRGFGSRKIAEGKATGIWKTHGVRMEPYLCQDCGQWHLFNKAKREKTRERQRRATA